MSKPGDFVSDNNPIELDVHSLKIWKDDVKEKDWEGDAFTFVCCDCALVHHVAVIRNTKTKALKVCMSRDDRSTAQYRRYEDGNLHRGVGKWRMIRNG